MEPLAFINGRLAPYADLGLPWHDAGVVYGATVTELVRTFHHQLFRLNAHLTRLRQSCRLCHVPLDFFDADIADAARQLVDANSKLIRPQQDLALVIFATPGPVGRLIGATHDGPPTLAMHTSPLPWSHHRRMFASGAHLITPKTIHVPTAAVDRRAKHRSRMHWWIAGQEARARDCHAEPLLLDELGQITETPTANLILVRDGQLVTPANCLPGISLQVVRELAQQCNLSLTEQVITLNDCEQADELLITSTTYCLAGVSQLNNRPVAWPHEMYQTLLQNYSDLTGLDIAAQILTCC